MEPSTFRLLEYPRLLDYLSRLTVSESGARACHELYPYQDASELEKQIALLREAFQFSQEIVSALSSFPPLEGVNQYLDREGTEHILDLDALWAFKQILLAAKTFKQGLNALDEDLIPLLRDKAEVSWPSKLAQALKRCLNSEGELKDESSPRLLEVRGEIRNIQKQCTKKVNELLQQDKISDYLQDEFLTISSDRYVLALKSNFKGRIKGIIHDYSQSGETCYFEPLLLLEQNNQLQEAKQKEREAEREVLRYLTNLVLQEREQLNKLYFWLVEMDVLGAKLRLAEAIQGQPLQMGEDFLLDLREARHPLLILDGFEAEPVDIELREEQRALVISGGNAGGKTVCLKTLGITALMALSALPVAVEEGSSLPFWEKIFVFMGDEQSLKEHLSTFTAQIEHFEHIWPQVDSKSLIIQDEFGAGTDPSQGAALAQAVVDGLLEKNSWVAVATHFPALKAYALAKPRVRAASVLFDPQNKQPLYKLAYDQVGASQALDVARQHGLPNSILRKAEEYLLLEGQDSSGLLDRLNELALKREREITELKEEREQVVRKGRRLREQYAKDVQRLEEELRFTAQQILKDWKAGKVGRKKALKELAETRKNLKEQRQGSEAEAKDYSFEDLFVGQTVLYKSWNKKALIREKDSKKKQVKLDLGGVNLWSTVQEIAPETDKQEQSASAAVQHSTPQAQSLTLDLRGQRKEEVGPSLTRFLDKALLQGRTELQIIHGKGTGTLREEVHALLSDIEQAGTYYFAPADQGGEGVTIVELR
jgi:DNA mismatch repair protein MutS2